MSLLVTPKALFYLKGVVEQSGLKQLGVDYHARSDYIDLKCLGGDAENERAPCFNCFLSALRLRLRVM